MNRKTFLFLAIFMASLLPVTATAAVIINDPILVSANQNNAVVYITNGPGYSQAHSENFMYASYTNSGENVTLDLNYPHHGGVNITNALEIVNNVGHSVNVWLNGTLPSYITMYNSSTEVVSSSSSYGTEIVSHKAMFISSGSVLYITIVMNTLSGPVIPQSVTLTLQYAQTS